MTDDHGFTLLEMVVAMAIFAVVGAVSYAGLDRAMTIRTHLQAVQTRWEAYGLAYDRLADDLSQVRARSVRDGAGALVPAFIVRRMGHRTEWSFTMGGARPWSVRPRSHLRRVSYTVVDGNWVWRRWAVLDRVPGERRAQQVLLHGVRRVRVEPLAANGRYVRTWPLVGQPMVQPRLVKVVVTLADGHHLRWLFAVGR
ncbi:MAG TPA: type II secretion system minor pseudopilin GspJ [Acidiferrobacter sp.]|nr:type II secretion system minor pseudopilin GspJ [Acidiferrobacter sp.]